MRKKDASVYLEDIFNAIEHIEKYAVGGKQEFLRKHMKQDAIIRQLAVIGEAVKKLSSTLKKKHTDIPWKDIADMRDILIHNYADVDLDTIWNTVKQDLPSLK